MLNVIKEFGQSIGLIRLSQNESTRCCQGSDYLLKNEQDKEHIHLEYLYKLDEDENSRLTLLESKTSQLIAQTGIIFSLLSLFVPILIDKVADVTLLTKIVLLFLLLAAFSGYILTINNALKNFKVNDFNYVKPSPKNVITFQDRPTAEFYNEVIKDLIDGLHVNAEINNRKATNLLHSYKSFKLANIIMAILVTVFCLTLFFFKSKGLTVTESVKVKNLNSAIDSLFFGTKKHDSLMLRSSRQDTFKISPIVQRKGKLGK